MKRTIYGLIILATIGGCFTTSAMAFPEITGLRGAYGVIATASDVGSSTLSWKIMIDGEHIFRGDTTKGVFESDNATFRTPLFPPALGFGKIDITVHILWNDEIPLDIAEASAFMLGPFVLFLRVIP